ncbi:serine/threonine protein kinase [Kitasatospora gansuensis]
MSLADPYADPYFADALRAAAALKRARAHGTVAHYEIVRQLDGPHATVLVGRRPDGELLALKGFAPDRPVSPGSLATRESEALRMMRFGFGGVVPLEETLSLISGGPVTYLCMPYCQGGSLRDRLTAGQLDVAELAYHGLALAASLQRLHRQGLIHGDVKPENLLFHHGDDGLTGEPARWHTWLSDLESPARVGGPTYWRMTPEYAAPEQQAGAPPDPAMDIWAWGTTLRDSLANTGPLPADWRWLTELAERATSAEPTDRPTAVQLIDTYARQIGFGDHRRPLLGAPTATAWYPLASMPPFADPWTSTGSRVHSVRASFGWAAWLPECERLYGLNTVPALTRLAELGTRALGDPADPAAVWRAFHHRPALPAFPISGDGAITVTMDGTTGPSGAGVGQLPRQVALTFVRLLTTALVELVEATGADSDLEQLRAVAEAWDSIGEFAAEADTALLAQAWLTLGATDRALPYVRRGYAAPDAPSALAALRLYYVVAGDHAMAAKVSMRALGTADGPLALRWLLLAVVDLLEAAEYDALDAALDRIQPGIDVVELVRLVAAGRRGPVRAEPPWPALRGHFRTVSSTASVQVLRYLAEAAHQRGDLDYARRCATVALARPELRLPANQQVRAALEALALGQS